MGNFSNNVITDVGKMLLADVQAGGVFVATRIVLGSGSMSGGATTRGMTNVITPVTSLAINKKKRTPDGMCIFGGVYTNKDVTAPFYFRELALYAKAVYLNEDGTVKSEGTEILYSYGNAGATADYMPAYSTSTMVEKQIDLVTWVGNDAQVDLTIESEIYITHADFDTHASRHAADGDDPLTPADIGAVPLDGSESMTGKSLYLNNRSAQVGASESRAVLNSYDTAGTDDSYRGIAVFNKNDGDDIAKALCFAVRNEGAGELLYRIYGEHNKPTAADVSAVNKAGDTMEGRLWLGNGTFNGYGSLASNETQVHLCAHANSNEEGKDIRYIGLVGKKDKTLPDLKNAVFLATVDELNGTTRYNLYGEHNSPAVVATAELI